MRSASHGYRLATFGRLSLVNAGGVEDRSLATRPRKLALLAWLVMHPGRRATRDQLLGVFWAERDEARARNSLSDAISHLRRALGRDAIRAQGNEVVLDESLDLHVDALELLAASKAGDHATVTSLYAGPFLDAFYVNDAPGFGDWRDRQAARFAELFAASAAPRCVELLSQGKWDDARRIAERWMEEDPASAEAAIAVLRAIDGPATRSAGVAALAAYESIERRLERELELAVDPSVSRHAAKIRERVSTLPDEPMDEPAPSIEPATVSAAPNQEASSHRWPARRMLGLAAGIVVLLSAAAAIRSFRRPPTLDRHRVIVEPFRNNTGDTSLARIGAIAADWISRGLSETGRVEVLDPEVGLSRPAVDPRVLGAQAGAGTVVMGSYVRHGDSITLDARIVNANSGKVMRSVEGVSAPIANPIDAVEAIRKRVTGAMAVEVDPLLGSLGLTASEPPAYGAYLAWIEGLEQFVNRRFQASITDFRRAVAIDSQFMAARVWLAVAHCNKGELARCDSILETVAPKQDSMAPLDRLAFDLWRSTLRGDNVTRYAATTRMARRAPTSELALYLAGLSAIDMNRYEESIGYLSRIDADKSSMAWDVYGKRLARAYHLYGKHDAELVETDRRLRHQPADLYAMEERATALAALGRTDDVSRQADLMVLAPHDSVNLVSESFLRLGLELLRHGHPAEAIAMQKRAVAWARTRLATGAAPDTIRGLLMRALYESQSYDAAKSLADSLVARHPENPVYLSTRGLVAARRGDSDEANHVSRQLARMTVPYDRGATTFERARIAVVLGQREQAMDLMRQSRAEGKRINEFHLASEFHPLLGYPPFDAFFAPR